VFEFVVVMSEGSLLTNPNCKMIHPGRNPFFNKAIEDISKGVRTYIFLESKNINSQQIKHLAEALRSSSVTTLDIGHNKVGDEGVRYLAASLRSSSTLTDLCINGNHVGDEGAQHLAEALRNNFSITTLYIRSNNIGTSGIKYLAQSLQGNVSLTKLDLRDNNVGAKGIKCLAAALRSNSSIMTLYIKNKNMHIEVQNQWTDNMNARKTCLLSRDKVYQLLFCSDFVECPLCDRSVVFTTFRYLAPLESCNLIPECWHQ